MMHLNVPHDHMEEIIRTLFSIYKKIPLIATSVEWMKGICHTWSRGQNFSSSLPSDWYLKLSSQKQWPGRNLGEHRLVRRSGTASRGTALLVFCLRMRSIQWAEALFVVRHCSHRACWWQFVWDDCCLEILQSVANCTFEILSLLWV